MAALALCPSWEEAQPFAHLYGGATFVPKDNTRAVVAGGVFEFGPAYLGFDRHSLQPTGDIQQDLDGLGDDLGLTFKVTGYDFSIGPALFGNQRYSVIPMGIVGYTRGEFCLVEVLCEDARLANYGGEVALRVMASSRAGIHAGVRYTRNYGATLTIGVVLALN